MSLLTDKEILAMWEETYVQRGDTGIEFARAIESAVIAKITGFDVLIAYQQLAALRAKVAEQATEIDRLVQTMAEQDTLIEQCREALQAMCKEFRDHDLPYGSSAYRAANEILITMEKANAT